MEELIALAVKAIQAAVKYAPGLIEDLRKLFAMKNPTEADWQALHDKIASKSYEDYVPDSAIGKVPPS
jgi:hypothetical protein